MPYYVYIIQSEVDRSYYKGFTEDPLRRLQQHNGGESAYTRNKIPWKLVYVEEWPTKQQALIRERGLKKYSHAQIAQLLLSPRNKKAEFEN
jgi:putative endonuclease